MHSYRWVFIVIIAIAAILFAVPVFSDEEEATSYPSAAHLYKTDYKFGSLVFGQSMIYPFVVSGERTYLEWIVLSTDCTSNEDDLLPCAASLYIYEDCDPSLLQCIPSFSSIGSANAYIGVPSPQNGSVYYAEVEAIPGGSGQYNLITRSYTTQSPIIMTEDDTEDLES